ncbi:MAG TPA: hypothetical protein VFD73_28005 [Gemmatimonadales bacterium]|nr:hypothetical protein [Gemmatimonadales bacterium]
METLRSAGSFEDNPAAVHNLDLEIQPIERSSKISSCDAIPLSAKGSAPGKKPIAWHQPDTKAWGFRSDILYDHSWCGERATRILDIVERRGEGPWG